MTLTGKLDHNGIAVGPDQTKNEQSIDRFLSSEPRPLPAQLDFGDLLVRRVDPPDRFANQPMAGSAPRFMFGFPERPEEARR